MIRGIYTSASGMILNQKLMDITANNVANVSTTGFKRMLRRLKVSETCLSIGYTTKFLRLTMQ